ncbi:MAG: protein serine/threonine phosphatase 2C family protein [Verrucomicrobia bacterium]|nr:protein serine/threonine phosphatase 2C family protein [Verrucomicrobiota bacterium]
MFQKKLKEKMLQNCKKALKEHAALLYPLYKGVYASLKEIFLSDNPQKLRYTHLVKDTVGRRSQMEDRHFYIENEKGILLGVLDGHNGIQVANYAAYRFQEQFFSFLEELDYNIYQAFLDFFLLIQEEIEMKHPGWDQIGTTVVVCYVEKETNYLYTATLGDSEANIYRLLGEKRKSIPLSCIRNWSTKRDFVSAKKALGVAIPYKKNPKEMRHPPFGESVHSGLGLNVSRALGDASFKGVIHSPKITATTLLPGDILLLACDGLKDFVPEKEIIQIIDYHLGQGSLVQALVDHAIIHRKSTDNVTISAVFVYDSDQE